MTARGLVVAGTHSGVGKTTVTAALAAACAARGLTVQPYKAGPDYIDPGHLGAAAGREARNLDTWMLPRPVVAELCARAAADVDVALVEGVMGLFDGPHGASGSTADLAAALGLPVVLVVDARHQSQSLAALVHGFATYRPDIALGGVIAKPRPDKGVYSCIFAGPGRAYLYVCGGDAVHRRKTLTTAP